MENLYLILCYLVISVALIVAGLINWYLTKQFIETAQRTTGTVIELVQRSGCKWRIYYFALLFGGLGTVFFIVYIIVLFTLGIDFSNFR